MSAVSKLFLFGCIESNNYKQNWYLHILTQFWALFCALCFVSAPQLKNFWGQKLSRFHGVWFFPRKFMIAKFLKNGRQRKFINQMKKFWGLIFKVFLYCFLSKSIDNVPEMQIFCSCTELQTFLSSKISSFKVCYTILD